MRYLESIMNILRSSLFDNNYSGIIENENDAIQILEELDRQAVLPIVLPVLKSIAYNDAIYQSWKRKVLKYVSNNLRIIHEEKRITNLLNSNGISYAVIKGTAFAQYYPNPNYRIRGDIDILISENNYDRAAPLFLQEGYVVVRDEGGKRHTKFYKNHIEIELHRYFSILDRESLFFSVEKAVPTLNDISCFPAVENGICMLLHIQHHIGQIGLRHYLDWIMYAKNICDDDFWNNRFEAYAKKYGVDNIAKALTKVGKKYFPLNKITWCDGINDSICDELLDEFFESGNFNRNPARQKALTVMALRQDSSKLMKIIYQRGIDNWKPAQNNKLLAPIAFFRQLFLYTSDYVAERGIIGMIRLRKDTKRVMRLKKM